METACGKESIQRLGRIIRARSWLLYFRDVVNLKGECPTGGTFILSPRYHDRGTWRKVDAYDIVECRDSSAGVPVKNIVATSPLTVDWLIVLLKAPLSFIELHVFSLSYIMPPSVLSIHLKLPFLQDAKLPSRKDMCRSSEYDSR